MLNPLSTVNCNPAYECLKTSSSVLLLQGPLGPSFDRLTIWLKSLGKHVNRVVFSAGDALECRVIEPIHFKGRPETWRKFLLRLMKHLNVDCLVLFGQSRYYHRVASELAARHNKSIVVLEEGYFRPGFVTMELDGVNGYSRTLHKYLWKPAEGTRDGIQPDITPWHFQKMALHAIRHYVALRMGGAEYPLYRHHREENPYHYAAYWLRSWARKLLRSHFDKAFQRKLFKGSVPYFLVPLQYDGDAQITHHSPYGENTDFIIQVMRSFADHASPDHWLVFRQHPHSRGGPGHSRLIQSLALEFGIHERVHHMVEGDTPDLAQHSVGVVLINSTVGFQALERGVPLMVLGDALYKQPSLTHSGRLNTFWTNAQKPDFVEVQKFLAQVKNLTQMPCSVYANRQEPLRWE